MIEYLPLVLTGIGIIVSILYYTTVLQNANKAREVQITLQITNNFDVFSKPWSKFMYTWNWENFDDFWTKYGPDNNLDEWSEMFQFFSFIENIGVLVKRTSLAIDLVDDVFSGVITDYWEKIEPIVNEWREEWSMPDLFIWTEHLADELNKLRIKRWK